MTDSEVVLAPTLDELFSRDPDQHTPGDRHRIYTALREARERWFIEEQDAKSSGRRSNYRKGANEPKALKTAAAKGKKAALDMDMDLGDLDI